MKRTISILSAIIMALATSCVGSKLEQSYNNQESKIDSYINGKGDQYRSVRNGGANRLVLKEGTGEELAGDGYVSFYYAGYTFSGSVSAANMFTTNRKASAEEAGWQTGEGDFELYEINFKDSGFTEGLQKGLTGVRAGEECEILFSAKYGFGNKALGIIPAKTALLYRIWVVGVTND